MNSKPFLIEGIVGNGRMLCTLGPNGELFRLWWPQIHSPHHVNEFLLGVFVENFSQDIAWLNGEGWTHRQCYLEDTNCLVTSSASPTLPVAIEVTDFCLPDSDTLARNVDVISLEKKPLNVTLYVSASFAIAESTRYNAVQFDREQDALVFYRHKYAFAVGSDRPCTGYEAGKPRHLLTTLIPAENPAEPPPDGHEIQPQRSIRLNGNVQAVGMHGALSWTLSLSAEEKVTTPIFLSAGDTIESAIAVLKSAKTRSASAALDGTVRYWHLFLERSRPVHTIAEPVRCLYRRSLLAIKLLCDGSGAIVAAPEFDEDFSRCGGYSYCWGRDAAYICTAIDKAGYPELVTRFYDWTLGAQSPNGSWAQRHFMDGTLAPQWGFQIDETGSILWGMWQHYLALAKDSPKEAESGLGFARRIWTSVKRAADFLTIFIDPETKLPLASKDLWEERVGEHLYSAAAVVGGLQAAVNFAHLLDHVRESKAWVAVAANMLDTVLKIMWSEERGHFVRSLKVEITEAVFRESDAKGIRVYSQVEEKGYVRYYANIDSIVDSSLLGLSVPFEVIRAQDRKMVLTAEEIRRKLTAAQVGGLMRYEKDRYAGGNPWIVTTLWMGLYDLKRGEVELSRQALLWAVSHQTKLGLLPEQVDRNTGETAWCVPLTWSHAMFVLHVLALDELRAI